MNKTKILHGVVRDDFASVLDAAGGGSSEANLSKKKKAQRAKEAKESKKHKDPNAPMPIRIPLPNWLGFIFCFYFVVCIIF